MQPIKEKLERLGLLKNGAFIIDASTLEGRFMTCPREYYYYGVRKLQGGERKEGLMFGSFTHDHLLAPHYRGKHPQIDSALEHFPVALADDYRNGGYAKLLWKMYTDSHEIEPFTILNDSDGKPAVELAFATYICTVRDVPVIWAGRIDLLTQWSGEPGPSVMDHKTSSIGGEQVWEQYSNSTQQNGYVWAVQTLLGLECSSYCVNLILTRKLTATGKGIEFFRQRYPVEQEIIRGFPDHIADNVEHLFYCIERDSFPMHTSQCTRKYGACEFTKVCKLPPSLREPLLQTGIYQPVTWSPLV